MRKVEGFIVQGLTQTSERRLIERPLVPTPAESFGPGCANMSIAFASWTLGRVDEVVAGQRRG
jgi:hypothetical protein